MTRRRPSFALVVAVLALVVALGGTSYAVAQLPKNSVGTPQLQKGAVTATKIRPATRRALRGRPGPVGPRGQAGPTGAAGPSFGATVTAASASSVGCTSATMLTLPITVTRPTRILGSATAAFDTNGVTLDSGILEVRLYRGDTLVAEAPRGFGTTASTGNQRIPLAVNAVLGLPGLAADLSTAYVADPGGYELRLVGSGGDGGCSGSVLWWYPTLTYLLVGTAP